MVVWTWIQHHRFLSVAVLAIVILGGAGGTCWAVFFRTVASPVSLRDALRLYHHEQPPGDTPSGSTTSPTSTSPSSPAISVRPTLASGVYSYRTSGHESLSLLGVSRSFPSRTNMLVTQGSAGCSVVEWVPLTQHTERTTVCPSSDHSEDVAGLVTYEQIGGSTTTDVIDCPATMYFVPPIAAVGVHWSATCHEVNPSENIVVNGLVVGGGPIEVGGQAIQTVHVRLTFNFDGVAAGVAPSDYWISTTRGLVVREQELAQVTQDGVHYTEQMDTVLTSLTPAR